MSVSTVSAQTLFSSITPEQQTLEQNPAYMQITTHGADTTSQRLRAVGYASVSGNDTEGDFMPYNGTGNTEYNVGAKGEYSTKSSGTLAGHIQYSKGKQRNVGWSAMRLPELYLPYISTDSCGGDFKYDSYYAEGSYAFDISKWTLGVKASFYGDQAYRLTDPRALNNTTWLRFNAGVGRYVGKHLLMLDAGYARNKQHMQLRYWRPGQQDRFFVCYGFGLYDTRQSAVSFGKSRMYYVDELNMLLQYLSPQDKPLRMHAAIAYTYDNMETEESDIYNLYRSETNIICPQLSLTWLAREDWRISLHAEAEIESRRGYENIIEEYLANVDYNSYDFRIIDSQQNYNRDLSNIVLTAGITHDMHPVSITLQGGMTTSSYKETYMGGLYNIKVCTTTPHAMTSVDWFGKTDKVSLSLKYSWQRVGSHHYDVQMVNTSVKHLDFQHAFAPYAYRCADYGKFEVDAMWQHKLKSVWIGMNGKLAITRGNRLDDVSYNGTINYNSSAPMLSPLPNKHNDKEGSLTLFVIF